eukprot:scaffold21972_cov123-Isochrysis_galbana.AAC.4
MPWTRRRMGCEEGVNGCDRPIRVPTGKFQKGYCLNPQSTINHQHHRPLLAAITKRGVTWGSKIVRLPHLASGLWV